MSTAPPPTRQLPLALVSAPTPSFDNFLAGANAAAVDHLRALTAPGLPVYLWGPTGSGKTHLLQATLHAARAAGMPAVELRPGDRIDADADADAAPSLVVIDACDRLDADTQAHAFRAFVEAASHGMPVVAAGHLPPIDLPLREDLRTRLGSGLVFALQPLTDGDRRTALRQEAGRRGLTLSDELLHFLLTRFERDLASLMALLDRLDQYALARGRALTVPLLREMLQEPGRW